MSYLVLARKYRPQKFAELVGQEHVARTLTNAIAQNRVHHAFLFTGARGVGKTSAARILAKALCCVKGPTAEPCGVCEACTEIVAGNSVDVAEIDGASNTGVDDVRALREGVRYLPAKGRLKVYIIDEVHMLSTSAFNALLKTLEEPPPHVVFIFATTEAHKIPTTILSRCQRYDFKLIPTARLVTHLESILAAEKIAFEPDGLRLLARQAAGSVRDGLSLLDQVIAYVGDAAITRDVVSDVLGVADRSLLVSLARAILARDVATTLRGLAAAVERGLDLGQLARAFLGLLRDIEIVARVPAGQDVSDLIDASPEELEDLRELAAAARRSEDEVAPPGVARRGMGPDLVAVLFDRWARAVDETGKASNPRLILEMAAVDLCQAEPLVPLGDLMEKLELLEGRLRSGGAPTSPPPSPSGGRGGGAGAPSRPPTDAGPRSAPADAPAAPARPVMTSVRAEVAPVSAVTAVASAPPVPVPQPEAPPVSVPANANANAVAPAAVARSTPVEAWRRARAELERTRPRVGALLANASVLEIEATKLVLGFADRADVDATERLRSHIEPVLNAEFAAQVRLIARQSGAAAGPTVMRAETVDEADTQRREKQTREQEARRHPMIQKAQDLFNASIREIKTP